MHSALAARRPRYRYARGPRAALAARHPDACRRVARAMAAASGPPHHGHGMIAFRAVLDQAAGGATLSDEAALALADCDDLAALMVLAAALRDQGHGPRVSYSRKVFIPLTRLCRDCCRYCTRSEEHTSELQSHSDLVCRLLLEKKKRYVKSPEVTIT